MSFGNLGAASGAQPAAGPTGAPIFGNQNTVAPGAVLGQAGAAPNGATPFYQSSFESLMAAVSRGEMSLNQVYAVAGLGGLGNANGNPTLMQAISQGVPQNGTNGIGVVSGYGVGAGGAPGIPAVVSGTGAFGGAVTTASGDSSTSFGGAVLADSKQMVNAPAVAMASPIQYGGN